MEVPPAMCFLQKARLAAGFEKTAARQACAPERAGQTAHDIRHWRGHGQRGTAGKSIARAHFVQRVFGPEERALLQGRSPARRAETAAANFAAKEALAKALGTGLSGFVWVQAQALRAPNGAPYFAFSGRLAETMRQKGLAAHLSITHEGGLATAFVVLEQAARPAAHTTEATE